MTAQRLPRSTVPGAAPAVGRRRGASPRDRVRRGAPPVSWALVFAGLLAGGVLSFGAGVITGNQMTKVAYRGALPDSQVPAPDRAVSTNRQDERNSLPSGPRARQVAENAGAKGSGASVSDSGSSVQGDRNRPFSTDRAAAVSDGAASLVNLPQRNHWQSAQANAPEPNDPPPASGREAGTTPPPPLPKPKEGAPQRLTPMGGSDAPGKLGGDAAQRFDPATVSAAIWQIAVPTKSSDAARQWALFNTGLAPSAHWQADQRAEIAARTATPATTAAQTPAGLYSVQVGAFRDQANALKQAARLADAGYAPRIVHAKATQSRLFMVRLGAFGDRPAASTFARQLAQKLDIDTWPVAN